MRYWWVNHKQTFRHEFEGHYTRAHVHVRVWPILLGDHAREAR